MDWIYTNPKNLLQISDFVLIECFFIALCISLCWIFIYLPIWEKTRNLTILKIFDLIDPHQINFYLVSLMEIFKFPNGALQVHGWQIIASDIIFWVTDSLLLYFPSFSQGIQIKISLNIFCNYSSLILKFHKWM